MWLLLRDWLLRNGVFAVEVQSGLEYWMWAGNEVHSLRTARLLTSIFPSLTSF